MVDRIFTAAEVDAALADVMRRFQSADDNPSNSYGYNMTIYAAPFDGSNWGVTGKGGWTSADPTLFARYEEALNEVRRSMPIVQ